MTSSTSDFAFSRVCTAKAHWRIYCNNISGTLTCMFRYGASRCFLSFHASPIPTALLRVRPFYGLLRLSPTINQLRDQDGVALIMGKRKSLSTAVPESIGTALSISPPTFTDDPTPPAKRRASQRRVSQRQPDTGSTNPNTNANVLDAPEALRASPDASEPDERMNLEAAGMDVAKQVKEEDSDSPLSEMSDIEPPTATNKGKAQRKATAVLKTALDEKSKKTSATSEKGVDTPVREPLFLDPEADGEEEADEEEIQAALARPPPVNSDYLPLPWKGRLGYVRVNVFSLKDLLTAIRHVFAHISAFQIHPCSVQERVVLPPYLRIAILSKTRTNRLMQRRTDQIKNSLPM